MHLENMLSLANVSVPKYVCSPNIQRMTMRYISSLANISVPKYPEGDNASGKYKSSKYFCPQICLVPKYQEGDNAFRKYIKSSKYVCPQISLFPKYIRSLANISVLKYLGSPNIQRVTMH